ncbi:uncharacterized protein EI97DRAFT_464820 [Westerdykella ornata]|uniref:Uncharacterized protein n=1 Tax=Westerdykella ornata TaxID=318751 RepID=A0A6A6JUV3_WESOR|nr:uncharacterized protein EI97DRAFT_464820 [Westerdykella ornata]KAF2279598.1 hypothetical protein EI97DRAFT_464820 [Westerdykella ornata]
MAGSRTATIAVQKREGVPNLKAIIGSLTICIDDEDHSCTTLDALDKCVNLNGDNGNLAHKISSLETAEHTACLLYRDFDCTNPLAGGRAIDNTYIPQLKALNPDERIRSVTCWEQHSLSTPAPQHSKRARTRFYKGPIGMLQLCLDTNLQSCVAISALQCISLRNVFQDLQGKINSVSPTVGTRCTLYTDLYCKGNTLQLDRPLLNLGPLGWAGATKSFICADHRYDKRNEGEEGMLERKYRFDWIEEPATVG